MVKAFTASELNGKIVISILALLSVFAPLSTDMYLSAFSDIQSYLRAEDGALELSLSVFFLGLCTGQLLFGPLIDRYGRRAPLLTGIAIFCGATTMMLLTSSASHFIVLRFIQAIGACGGMVVGRAVVSDLYRGVRAARTMTILVMLMALGPVLSPLLGGILVSYFGWKSIFITMLAIGMLAFLLSAVFLPETLPVHARSEQSLIKSFASYRKLLISRNFILLSLVSAFVQAAMFSFITASSSVFQGVFGLSNIEYGVAFAQVSLSLLLSSWLNNKLLMIFSVKSIISTALPVLLLVSLILISVSDTDKLWVFITLLCVVIAMVGLLGANTTSLAMEAAHGLSGVGSAFIGSLQFGIAFVCSAAIAACISESALPLAMGITIPALIASLMWLFYFFTAKNNVHWQ
ncbi:TPA: multidrug effflux MFS transporter [Enterobacter hormaechei subsp. steigerwaltii]|nr:multidrug effflux MFS transporter [Enterobacter hormaechei subsp. steigerwaltii]